jgi:recombination protein RecR
MGRLSPLDGVGPREIGLDRLLRRATDGEVREVVLATNFTNEGGHSGAIYIRLSCCSARGPRRVAPRARRALFGGRELEYVGDAARWSQALRRARPFAG